MQVFQFRRHLVLHTLGCSEKITNVNQFYESWSIAQEKVLFLNKYCVFSEMCCAYSDSEQGINYFCPRKQSYDRVSAGYQSVSPF